MALLAAALVTVVGAGVLLGPREALAKLPWALGAPCTPETVDIVVAPELVSVVNQILQPVAGKKLAADHCLATVVRGQEPQETVASSSVLPIDRAPQIWIPDSTVWGQKTPDWPLTSAGPLAMSPVVIATSSAAAQDFNWIKHPPTWYAALRGSRPVAVPDYQAQSESIDALIALWQSLGKGKAAEVAVASTILAADRGEVPSPEQAISDAMSGSKNAPLIPSTEQAVAHYNATSDTPNLTAVYPSEGSPMLNYPIYQVAGSSRTPSEFDAIRTVIGNLTSDASQNLVRKAGFRDSTGSNPEGTGIKPDNVLVLNPPTQTEVDAMLTRIQGLAKPSRVLVVVDVSLSMTNKLQDGITRIQLAGAACRLGANQLPDSSSVGAWLFATNMKGDQDWRVLAPVKRLGSLTPSGETYRSYLMGLANNVDQYLHGGGTGLYDTTIGAMRDMHKNYDPKADNVILLLSDGGNDDPTGTSLNQALNEINKSNAGQHKVQLYTVGLGPDADYPSLRALAKAGGGTTYRIDTAGQGEAALLDGLRRFRHLGT
jgi:Mg-chelatase subunit ChlD